jgi:pimeloyl-ACP methyl ester carboxylesterase
MMNDLLFSNALNEATRKAGMVPNGERLLGEQSVPFGRRGGRRLSSDPIELLSLTENDGVLRWNSGSAAIPMPASGRRGTARRSFDGAIVNEFKFQKLSSNQVGTFLSQLDGDLTPQRGLRPFEKNGLGAATSAPPPKRGRILLFIHGTFSRGDIFFEHFVKEPHGQKLLKKFGNYDAVYAFDHPTVSVSPILNALDLSRLFADTEADIDVICHSRGGLVCRWWLEIFHNWKPNQKISAVLVGSPLGGTSLAAAGKLRHALDFLTNIARVLGVGATLGSAAVPLLALVTGLLRVITSISGTMSNTPLVDAAVAMIPGLNAQAMVTTNEEMLRLSNRPRRTDINYFAVTSNFQPIDPQWRFWRYFVQPTIGASALTSLVFEGPNDLVVDTQSMTSLGAPNLAAIDIEDFGDSPEVHHLNYFLQKRTCEFIATRLKI